MVTVTSSVLFADALAALVEHKKAVGVEFRGRFVQIFLGMKFFQNNIPSMYSGSFITTEVLQSLLDDLYAKASRNANSCVLSIFEDHYLARTGVVGAGNSSAQNTWRNNLNLQKGIGCYAPTADLSSPTFLNQSRDQCKHLQIATAGTLRGAHCSLCTSGAAYRKESHRKWLRIDPGGSGYAATDLQNAANFTPYVAPGGVRIPVLPLIVSLYHDADPGLVLGMRQTVTLADFVADFNFSSQEIAAYFDVSPTHPLNARVMNSAGWVSLPGTAVVPPPTMATSAPVARPVTPQPLQPLLGGTPTPPPNTNNGWDAEQYVAAALAAAGWTTHAVSSQRLGYDIFAQKGRQKRYVEAKSSVGMCSPSLTAREWQQAHCHGASFVLAIIENFNPTAQNVIHWVSDPAHSCVATPQTTISHGIARSSWAAATVPLSGI